MHNNLSYIQITYMSHESTKLKQFELARFQFKFPWYGRTQHLRPRSLQFLLLLLFISYSVHNVYWILRKYCLHTTLIMVLFAFVKCYWEWTVKITQLPLDYNQQQPDESVSETTYLLHMAVMVLIRNIWRYCFKNYMSVHCLIVFCGGVCVLYPR